MKHTLSRILVAARALVIVCVFGLVFELWNFDRPPFALSKLDGLTQGMTQDQVREVLGAPSSVYEDSWAYSRTGAWPIVYVYFDEAGKLVRHRYDY